MTSHEQPALTTRWAISCPLRILSNGMAPVYLRVAQRWSMLHGVVADRGAKGDHPLPLRILSGGMALLPSCKALSCCMAAGLLAGTGFDLRKLCYLC